MCALNKPIDMLDNLWVRADYISSRFFLSSSSPWLARCMYCARLSHSHLLVVVVVVLKMLTNAIIKWEGEVGWRAKAMNEWRLSASNPSAEQYRMYSEGFAALFVANRNQRRYSLTSKESQRWIHKRRSINTLTWRESYWSKACASVGVTFARCRSWGEKLTSTSQKIYPRMNRRGETKLTYQPSSIGGAKEPIRNRSRTATFCCQRGETVMQMTQGRWWNQSICYKTERFFDLFLYVHNCVYSGVDDESKEDEEEQIMYSHRKRV